jgi:hypothetical protein
MGKAEVEKHAGSPTNDVLLFCPCCFASSEGGSWGEVVIEGHCFNCGAGGSGIEMKRWAVDSIRQQASWVGKRYYPHDEDKQRHEELKVLRALIPSFPGRTARLSEDGKASEPGKLVWWVEQVTGAQTTTSVSIEAATAEEAIEASRFLLPYHPEASPRKSAG